MNTKHASELGLEFAYVDWLFQDYLGFRGGLLLAPLGFVNELHEPPIFLGVKRPLTETYIIPTTWREIGVGIFGSFANDNFSYKLYLMNNFKAEGFSAKSGLRGGRQKGAKALAEDFLEFAARLGLPNSRF